ncbi:MFS transporter [Pandoraea anhela]|uniref:Major facilitator transporter n=1 Tax=Pandoraea anhela TaxID=2508295 RepID=A0A5E4RA77_9BURK|nr:MFS transporter [Pandoraea anhela]VVD59681.1 major facilitator transporter [Pandoraea anhela]
MEINALAPSDALHDPRPANHARPEPHDSGMRKVGEGELNRVVLASVVGSFVEWFEFSVYGYLAAVLGKVFFPTGDPSVQLIASLAAFAIAFFARPFGGIVFGSLGDRYGRKQVLTVTIVMMAFATFAIGLIPSYGTIGLAAPVLLVLMRLAQGISAGGEASGAAIFVAEYCRDRNRTALTSWIEVGCMGGFFFGASISAVLALFFTVDQIQGWAWRLPFLLALPLGAIGLYIRHYLEETPAFEAMRQAHEHREVAGWRELFDTHVPALLQSSGIIIVTNVTLFVVVTYLPTYLVSALKLDVSTGFRLTLGPQLFLICMIPILGVIADRIGRKRMMLIGTLLVGVCAVPCFHMLTDGTAGTRILALGVLNLSLAALLSCVYSKIPALFDASVRFKGMALSYNVSVALFAGTAPMINAWLIQRTGSNFVPAYYLIAAAVVGALALVTSPDRTGAPMRGDLPN